MLLDLRSLEELVRGTIATSQSSQSAAAVALERFIVTATTSQSSQSESLTAREAFKATIAGTQGSQSESLAASERFVAAITATQAGQSDAITSREAFRATIGANQANQSASLTAHTPLVFSATITAIQTGQSAASTADTSTFPSVKVATIQDGGGGQNEIQKITVLATGGTFDLSQAGGAAWSLFDIPWDVSVAGLQALLDSQMGPGSTIVSGVVGSYIVEWVGVPFFADRDLPQMNADGTNLTAAAPVVEEPPPRHGPPLGAAIVVGPRQYVHREMSKPVILPAVAAIGTVQGSQSAALTAAEDDDELAFALLEAA